MNPEILSYRDVAIVAVANGVHDLSYDAGGAVLLDAPLVPAEGLQAAPGQAVEHKIHHVFVLGAIHLFFASVAVQYIIQ